MKKYGVLLERDNYLKFNVLLVAVDDADKLVQLETLSSGRAFVSAMRAARDGLDRLSQALSRNKLLFSDPAERTVKVQ